MDMWAVAEALAAAAATVDTGADPALISYAFTPDGIEVPCAFVAEYDVDFHGAYGAGHDVAMMTVRVLVGRADDKSAARRMAALLSGSGGGALKAALESARGAPGEPALGGAADDYVVQQLQGMRWYQHDQYSYLGSEFRVKVVGSS